MAPGAAAINVVGVTKAFGIGQQAVRALDGVSIDIRENEFITLLGPSGCGKTTLLRLIAGFETPTSGEIILGGKPVTHLPPFERAVNTVFQSYALFPHLTAAQNIGFGLQMKRMTRTETASRVAEMLDLVRMTAMGHRKPNQLSGGQQQRIALARALAPGPRVLLLDESLSALDRNLRTEMQQELKRLQRETGTTFVFVTHDQEEALVMSDRIALMSHGRIQQVGTPADIYERPANRFAAEFVGRVNFLPGELLANRGGVASVRILGGRRVDVPTDRSDLPLGAVQLALRPESIELVESDGEYDATISAVSYFGTDTILSAELRDALPLTIRRQNGGRKSRSFSVGERIAIRIPPEALYVLGS